MKHKRLLMSARSLIGLGLMVCASFAMAVDVPPLRSRVTDNIHLLTPEQRQSLETTLLTHEVETGNQIAILLLDHTAPESIEEYSMRVAEKWKIGRKNVDDGVILIIAKNNSRFGERRMRIEVGRGAEGVMTDAMCKRILQDILAPYFRQDDFYGGLREGIVAIRAVLKQDAFPAPPQLATPRPETNDSWTVWFLIFSFCVIAPIGIAFSIKKYIDDRRAISLAIEETEKHGIFIGPGWYCAKNKAPESGVGVVKSDTGVFAGDGGSFSGGGGDFGGGGASGDW